MRFNFSICIVLVSIISGWAFSESASAQSKLVEAHVVPEISKYPLLDSRIAFVGAGPHEIVWLDGERVTFFGKDQEKLVPGKPFPEYKRPSDPKRAGDSLYWDDQFIWNVRTGAIERPMRPMRKLCVYKKTVTYMSQGQSDDPTLYWYYGVHGRENRYLLSEKHWINPYSCRFYKTPPPWAVESEKTKHSIQPLLEEHGYLDLGPSPVFGGGSPTLVRNTDPKTLIKLSQLWGSGRPWHVQFAAHEGAYVLDNTDPSPKAFLLRPNGDLVSASFPPESPTRHGPITLTKKGFFYHNLEGRNNVEDVKVMGGYLLTENHLERIVVGKIDAEGVSADGCKIAFSHARSARAHYDGIESYRRGGLANTTVKMIDICK